MKNLEILGILGRSEDHNKDISNRKVIYTSFDENAMKWGSNDDPSKYLELGESYTLLEREIHTWHTKYILKEFPNLKFNSVHFTLAGE